jgi:Fe(3+) dicitrate transport protein
MAFDDRLLGGPTAESTQTVVLPGLGAHYALTPELGLLAGVHQGFSLVAPGQSDDVEPEKSLNFELGARYGDEAAGLRAEVVGFYSDYDNLLGQCTFSTGCPADQLDRQVNVGEVTVYGVEASGSYAFALGGDMWLPLSVSYTFTHGELDTSFVSGNPQYGEVEAGDALPYVPEHQVALTTGVTHADWGALLSATVVSPMREVAGKGEPAPGEVTDTQVYVDLAGHWQVLERLRLYVRVDNVLFQDPIVARAPFGARPGKPFSVMGGVTAKF